MISPRSGTSGSLADLAQTSKTGFLRADDDVLDVTVTITASSFVCATETCILFDWGFRYRGEMDQVGLDSDEGVNG